jgi:thioredoxin-like negative regulator of GroEL
MTPPGMTPPGVTPPGLSPGTGAPGAGPETPGATPSAPGIPSAAPQTPLQVQNFATGVEARGLHDLLQSADDLMRKGKFTSAMDEYDNAAAVAPNNPLVVIGRANAELAASLYSRAEADLRAAYGSDQAVMMAQYDLKDLIGEDRLKYLSDDLKQIADSSPNDSTPVFLLAYIDYNDHQEAQAAAYLDLAQKREGGNDDLIKSLMTHWTLPTTQPAGDMNK